MDIHDKSKEELKKEIKELKKDFIYLNKIKLQDKNRLIQLKKELAIAYKDIDFQNEEKEKRVAELIIANLELKFQSEEKEKIANELIRSNIDSVFQHREKDKLAAELTIVNRELAIQNEEREKRAAELVIANKELAFQSEEKEKRAAELVIANKELAFQNEEKEKRATELVIANKEKEKRAAELSIAIEKAEEFEKKFRQIAENIDEVFWLRTVSGISYISPSFERIWGISPEAVYENQQLFTENIHPDDKPIIQEIFNLTEFQDKGIFNYEYRILRDDSQVRWINVKTFPILNDSGEIIKRVGIAADSTEKYESVQKLIQAKEHAEESEIKYHTFFDNSIDAILLASPNGKIQSANHAACSMLGYSEDELIKLGRSGIVDLTDPRLSAIRSERKLKGKASGELTFIHKNGTHFPAEISSAAFKDYKGNDHISMIIRDNRVRKKLETNLSTAAEIAKLGYWEFDVKSGNFTFDDQYYRLIHGSSTEKQGGNIMSVEEFSRRLVHPDDSKIVGNKLQEAIGSPDPEYLGHTEARVFRDNGDITNVLVQFKVAKDDTGRTIKVVGVNQDITEQKRFEQELIRAKEHAEESDRLKSAFLANMSHEIRTPMNGILGFSGLLKEPGLTGEKQQKYIEIIEKSGERMLNIIQEIIDISKIESGQMEVKYKETNINKLIESIFNLDKLDADVKGINLSFKNSLPAKETIIKTDSEKLYSILTNLVKNAIKYTDKGSVEFGFKNLGKTLEFYVKDTGIGIPSDRQEAVFERFIQADIPDIQARQGAGLGLAIAKAFVEMLGGKIWVESEEGKGSTFYFTIKCHSVSESDSIIKNEERLLKEGNISGKFKVLVVEDDETSRELISIMLEKFAREIIEVSSGLEAVEVCRNNADIDLILMDIKMPGMNGFEATQQIRQFNKDVVIFAQTAYALTGDKEKAIDMGCNDYITKPINKSELDALIKKYLMK